MFNSKSLLYFAIAVNSVWIICGNRPESRVESYESSDLRQNIQLGTGGQVEELESIGDSERRSYAVEEITNSTDETSAIPALSIVSFAPNSPNLPLYDERVDARWPTNCAEATATTQRSGFYYIQIPALANDIALVECDAHTDDGGWTVIQRRHDGSVDFYLNWSDYKAGFGDKDGEFFIGLDKLYALTNFNGPQELMVVMESLNSTWYYAKYDSFAIGNESEKYFMKKLGKYTGTAGDSLTYHVGCKFSTKDQDNDNYSGHCAQLRKGAWWYNSCYHSNLNGLYGIETVEGIRWDKLPQTNHILKTVKMMIRRRRY